MPEWLTQTIISLIVSLLVFIAGFHSKQEVLETKLDNLIVVVTAVQADVKDIKDDVYTPRFGQ